jgi:flavin-dependent dehydrogenase
MGDPALRPGSRVAIIGGGPAGSFAALHLLEFSRQASLPLEVLIYEPRDFRSPGPAGCNSCAGILSSRVQDGIRALGLRLPPRVVQTAIRSYALSLGNEFIPVRAPAGRAGVLSVFRGGGPRLADEEVNGFDAYLLEQARDRGARHVKARVRRVFWDGGPQVVAGNECRQADLVILAVGVNSRSPLDRSFRYRAPVTAVMAQDEVRKPPDWPDHEAAVFFRHPAGLTFGAVIPKGRYLSVSLLGRGLRTDAVSDFLEGEEVRRVLPAPPPSLCGCHPRINVGAARRYYGRRWVAVGDAAATRLYKDGIGSAFATAEAAARAAVFHGVGPGAFGADYRRCCRALEWDNRYGRIIFWLWGRVLRTPDLLLAWKRVLQAEAQGGIPRPVYTRVLWGMLTGDEPYGELLRLALNLEGIRQVLRRRAERV